MIISPEHLLKEGFQIIPNLATEAHIESLKTLSQKFKNKPTEIRKNVFDKCDESYTVFKAIEDLLNKQVLACQMTSYCFFLEKTTDKNWPLLFHQDINLPQYLNLSDDEVNHWLTNGFWVRINLDANDKDTGAIKVIPRSHTNGKNSVFDKSEAVFLNVNEGDIVLFHPLLYHGSNKMKKPWERRVFQCFFLGKIYSSSPKGKL